VIGNLRSPAAGRGVEKIASTAVGKEQAADFIQTQQWVTILKGVKIV
jgi:hypothetical protein